MALTPAERTQIVDDAIAKLGTLTQAVVDATAEIVRLNVELQNAVSQEEFQALQAQYAEATAALEKATGELSQIDADLERLKTATNG